MGIEPNGRPGLGARIEFSENPKIDPADVVLIGVRDPGAAINDEDRGLLADFEVQPVRRMARNRFQGAAGRVLTVELERDAPAWVLLVGLGAADPGSARRAGAAVGAWLRAWAGAGDRVVDRIAADLPGGCAQGWFEGLLLGHHRHTPPTPEARESGLVLEVADPDGRMAGIAQIAAVMAGATGRARSGVATPGNIKGPQWLVAQAEQVANQSGLELTVWDRPALVDQGCGGLLAVGAGSARPPALVRLDHRPDGAQRLVVLVGKGITFDSGGLSLKPPDSMVTMKTDMSGAAAVLAAMSAVAELGVPVAVTGLLCLAENLPGASALRPGDVVTHRNGTTSEVRNTDAEGRLVLADGLALAAEMGADAVVDLATLTGAATLGLGRGHAALYATSDGLAAGLLRAGDSSGEALWRMPLLADYRDRITSRVASQANADVPPGPGPGSITAALFLQSFAGSQPWAHLDIAGPARSEAERDDAPKGGTGFGARLLLEWLRAGAPT